MTYANDNTPRRQFWIRFPIPECHGIADKWFTSWTKRSRFIRTLPATLQSVQCWETRNEHAG